MKSQLSANGKRFYNVPTLNKVEIDTQISIIMTSGTPPTSPSGRHKNDEDPEDEEENQGNRGFWER